MSRVGFSMVGLPPISDSSFGLVEKGAYHELLARLGRILRELPRRGFLGRCRGKRTPGTILLGSELF